MTLNPMLTPSIFRAKLSGMFWHQVNAQYSWATSYSKDRPVLSSTSNLAQTQTVAPICVRLALCPELVVYCPSGKYIRASGLCTTCSWQGNYADPWEEPKSRTPNSGLQYSYSIDYRALRWIYVLDPPRGLGIGMFAVGSQKISLQGRGT